MIRCGHFSTPTHHIALYGSKNAYPGTGMTLHAAPCDGRRAPWSVPTTAMAQPIHSHCLEVPVRCTTTSFSAKSVRLLRNVARKLCWRRQTYSCGLTQRCPSYVADLVAFCASDPQRRSLRSASTTNAAVIRRTRTELGRHAFTVCGPDVWNSLPPSLRTMTSHSAFRRSLKTHSYNLAFLS